MGQSYVYPMQSIKIKSNAGGVVVLIGYTIQHLSLLLTATPHVINIHLCRLYVTIVMQTNKPSLADPCISLHKTKVGAIATGLIIRKNLSNRPPPQINHSPILITLLGSQTMAHILQ